MASGETLRMRGTHAPLPKRVSRNEGPSRDRRLTGKKRTKARKAENRAARESLRA